MCIGIWFFFLSWHYRAVRYSFFCTWCSSNQTPIWKKLILLFTSHHMKSKIKLPEDNIGEYLCAFEWVSEWVNIAQCVRFFMTQWTTQSMEFSRQNTGVGSLSLLQGIFQTQGLNPGLPHCRRILYQLNHKGSPCALGKANFAEQDMALILRKILKIRVY